MKAPPLRWVGIYPHTLEEVVQRHQLAPGDERVLIKLLLWVHYREPHEYRCTLGALADRLGLHRTGLGPILDRLAAAGLIEYRFAKGHGGGVTVPHLRYRHLVHRPDREGPARMSTEPNIRTGRNGASPRSHVDSVDMASRTSRHASRERPSAPSGGVARGGVAAVVDLNEARRDTSSPEASTRPGVLGGRL